MASLSELEQQLVIAKEDPYEFFQTHDIKQLKIASHPDRWLGEVDRAKAIFEGFVSAHVDGQAGEHIGPYRIIRKLASGDLHNILLGKKASSLFVLKQPRVHSKRMQKLDCRQFPDHSLYSRLLPVYIETVTDINVFAIDAVHSSLSDIVKEKGKLDGRHVGWIGNRLWTILGYVHHNNVVNGAVVSNHIIVNKKTHGITLLGWIHSGKPGDKIQVVPKASLDAYPAWAKKDKKLTPALDIHMASTMLQNILPLDAPAKLRSFLAGIRNISNISAWEVGDAWAEVLQKVYGKPKWVELE